MKKIVLFLSVLTLTVVFAEGGHGSHGSHGSHASHGMMKDKASDRDTILNILKLNESLHSAFMKSNLKHIAMTAKKITASIDRLKDVDMKKMLMMSKINNLNPNTSSKTANKIYAKFSKHLVHLIKIHKFDETYKEFYCPMARKSWIQNISKNKNVQNPYMANMRSCGAMKS